MKILLSQVNYNNYRKIVIVKCRMQGKGKRTNCKRTKNELRAKGKENEDYIKS